MDEIWKPIENYEGYYEISSHGRVKSIERKIHCPTVLGTGCCRTVPERMLKHNLMKGYHCVTLQKDGKVKVFRVHRLVIEHFGEKQPSAEYQVNHIDGNKNNNCIDNLEWVTPLENTHHAIETGLRKRHPTEETLVKMSKASKERWQDKDYREFQKKMMKDTWERRKENGWTTWKTQN